MNAPPYQCPHSGPDTPVTSRNLFIREWEASHGKKLFLVERPERHTSVHILEEFIYSRVGSIIWQETFSGRETKVLSGQISGKTTLVKEMIVGPSLLAPLE